MHGLAIIGLVIIVFILVLKRRVSGLTTSASQCARCPTKPSGTYYTVLDGCTTAACVTCPTVDNGVNTLTPCADASSTNPTGSPGSCTLTCNTGYSKSTDGLSCVPDCVGGWGACSTTCGPGEYTYQVYTPAGPGGKACKDANGSVRNQGDKKPCANPDCGQNCEGTWSGWSGCSSVCGYGTKTRKFTGVKEARNGGTACETTYGLNAHWPESYETTTCTDLPACTSGQACEGRWSDWGACSAPCDGGIQTKTYTVTKAATVGTDGTRGAACPYADGATQQQACNTQSCCSKATVGAWEKYGSVRCSGNSSGKPEQLWVRNIVFPAGTPVNTTASSCSINQFATQYTAAGCPDVAPSAGTCSVTGAAWSAMNGCAITPATVTPTDGTCDFATGIDVGYKQIWDSSLGRMRDIKPTDPGGCKLNTPEVTGGLDGTCTDGGIYFYNYGCVTDPYRGKMDPKGRVSSLTCYTGFTSDVNQNKCIANPVGTKTLVCPTNYTPDLVNNTCKAASISITGLTCPGPYWSENRSINKCSATTVGDAAPPV